METSAENKAEFSDSASVQIARITASVFLILLRIEVKNRPEDVADFGATIGRSAGAGHSQTGNWSPKPPLLQITEQPWDFTDVLKRNQP